MNALPKSSWLLTVDEYLAFEERSDVRHEYVGGEIFAMAGASVRHAQIVGNIHYQLRAATRGGSCRVVTNDVKLQVAEDIIYYPDVILTSDSEDRGPYILHSPTFVAEVLSPTTSATDRREKTRMYLQLPSMLMYLIVHQAECRVDCYWRSTPEDEWRLDIQFDGSIRVPALEIGLALEDIYEDVTFDED